MTSLPRWVEVLAAAAAGAAVVLLAHLGQAPENAQAPFESSAADAEPRPVDLAHGAPVVGEAAARDTVKPTQPSWLGAVVYGTVRSSSGDRLTGAVVFDADLAPKPWLTRIADGGEYAIAGVPAGRGRLSASVYGFDTGAEDVEIAAGTERIRRDLILTRRPSVAIRLLTPEGERLAPLAASKRIYLTPGQNLHVVATFDRPGPRLGGPAPLPGRQGVGEFRTVNAQAAYLREFPPDVDGVLELLRPPPLLASLTLGTAVLRTEVVSLGMTELTFRVPLDELASAFGSVRFRARPPAQSGDVKLTAALMDPFRAASPLETEGWFLFEHVVAGPHRLVVTAGDRLVLERIVEVDPGACLDLGELPLGSIRALRGTVVDKSGNPVEAAVRYAPCSALGEVKPGNRPEEVPARRGAFDLPLESGPVLIEVTAGGFGATTRLVDTSIAGNTPLTIVLRRGVRVLLVLPDARIGAVHLTIADSEGRTVWWRDVRLQDSRVRVELAPGSYRLTSTSASGARGEQAFDVGSEPVRLEVAVP